MAASVKLRFLRVDSVDFHVTQSRGKTENECSGVVIGKLLYNVAQVCNRQMIYFLPTSEMKP